MSLQVFCRSASVMNILLMHGLRMVAISFLDMFGHSVRKADLRKQAKGLRQVHLRDCLIDAMTKKQHKRVAAIKQKCNQEESKHVWFLIKRMIKDPHSPSVLRVQWVIYGEVKEYTNQDEVENAIQQECKVRFTLAHSTPIMNTLLGERLRYLSDES